MAEENMLAPEVAPLLWTRDGFAGPVAAAVRQAYVPEYTSANGPHSPRRAVLGNMRTEDERASTALPTVLANSRAGLRISVSARRDPMPHVVRNVECDEIHFIQSGEVLFSTEFGELAAGPGDFVFIPRAVAYRYAPIAGEMRSLIVESPWSLKVVAPFGVIPPTEVVRSAVKPAPGPNRATTLLVKAIDDVTRFELPFDPTDVLAHVLGDNPVWKINLAKIQTGSFSPVGGPPVQLLTTEGNELCLFNLSARKGLRPPPHLNADYDEFIVYAAGPGQWGSCTEPGTVTWVPKGIPHQGPSEDVPEGYLAWLVECRPTLRWTKEALEASEPMETGTYGRHAS